MKTTNHFFFNTVENTVIKNNLIKIKDSILVAVSGGADSISLINVMLDLKEKMDLVIGIAHLNHCLRDEESERDSDFVKKLAEKLKLNLHLETINVKEFQKQNSLSLEDAARKLRYDFLQRTAKQHGYTQIATGHTANDNAELVLMNLIRGAGTSGLSGIPLKRGNIIRPIIEMTRKNVTDYLDSKNAEYVTDSSNQNKDFLRNKIRLDLLPKIKSDYNNNIVEGLNRTSRIIKEDEEWIETITQQLYSDTIKSKTDNSVTLSVSLINKLPLAAKRRVLRKAIEEIKGGLKKITLLHTEMTLNLTTSSKQILSIDLPDQIQVQKKGLKLIFTRHEEKLRDLKPEDIKYSQTVELLNNEETIIKIPEIKKKLSLTIINHNNQTDFKKESSATAWIDFDKLKFPLTIRNTHPMDKFVPIGMKGSQTLKKFFSSNNIGGFDKKNYPLLLSNDDIVWIGGCRLHEHYKIHEKTKKILKVELLLD